jgi:hypothetical protein
MVSPPRQDSSLSTIIKPLVNEANRNHSNIEGFQKTKYRCGAKRDTRSKMRISEEFGGVLFVTRDDAAVMFDLVEQSVGADAPAVVGDRPIP